MEVSPHARARAMTTVLAVAAAVLAGRAAQLQLARRPSAPPATQAAPTHPSRGRILDARGVVLADNVLRWELDVIPARLRAQRSAVARLAAAVGMGERDLDALLEGRGQRVVRVREYLDEAAAEAVRRAALPGAWLTPVEMRRYPQGAAVDPVVGVMRDVAPDDGPWPYGYRLGDRIGARGVERSWDLTLRGNSTLAPNHQGMTLVAHVDLRLQRAAWDALDGSRGTAVAIDPRDGRVLAYATRDASEAPLRRMRDPILAALARAHGVSLDARVPTVARQGGGGPCGARGGPLLRDVVGWGCDAPVEEVLRPARVDVGASLRRVGFGRPTGIDLRDELAGAVYPPDPELTGSARDASGPLVVHATPLQVAVAYSAIVNGGTVYQPRLVHEVRHPDGTLESRTTPVVSDRVDLPTGESQRTLASLAQWADARRDAHAYDGLPRLGAFGERAAPPTSSADWFVAVAPAEAPRIVVVAMTHEPHERADDAHPAVGAEPAALHILRAWHGVSSEFP